jgi:hypothetical protein
MKTSFNPKRLRRRRLSSNMILVHSSFIQNDWDCPPPLPSSFAQGRRASAALSTHPVDLGRHDFCSAFFNVTILKPSKKIKGCRKTLLEVCEKMF